MEILELRKTIMSQLYVVQAQMESIILLLEQMEEIEDNTCPHPIVMRENYTTMGQPEEWTCKVCGYHYREEEPIKAPL